MSRKRDAGPFHPGPAEHPTLIWFDPGGTTGWSLFTVHRDALSDEEAMILDNVLHHSAGQFTGSEEDQVDAMLDLGRAWPDARIGTEDFILRVYRKDRDLLAPVRLNAMIEYEFKKGRGGGGRRLLSKQPSSDMNSMTDDRMRRWGYYRPGQVHATDANRHALVFLQRAKARAVRRQWAWPSVYGQPKSTEEN